MLSHLGSVVTNNWHVLIVVTEVRASGLAAEHDDILEMLTMLEQRASRRSVGTDKLNVTLEFVDGARACDVTLHVTKNIHVRRTTGAIDGRTEGPSRHDVANGNARRLRKGLGRPRR